MTCKQLVVFRSWLAIRRTVGNVGRLLRIPTYLALDSLCELPPAPKRRVTLLLRLDAIGDFFIWLQSGAIEIAQYAKSGGRSSVLLANAAWADYARRLNLWDDVIDFEPIRFMRNPVYRLRLMLRIRRLGSELLIQPRPARVFLQEDAIARVSGASKRIGCRGTDINTNARLLEFGNSFYDALIAVDVDRSVHETHRNDQFTRALTGRSPTGFSFPATGGDERRPYVAVALGAGQIGRVWPIANLVKLIEHIRTRHANLVVLLLGGPGDAPLAIELANRLGTKVENLVGCTQLHEYVTIISRAHLVVCNDSSAYHIAMAFRRRVLCFLGGGHFGWFAPYPATHNRDSHAIVLSAKMDCFWCSWQCRYPRSAGGAFRCVASIPLTAAVTAVEDLLQT